ncbi:hypothetical protein Curi_c27630 [Gottschalkia acidurici 9a]|uniref:DUF4178 domain-containing protein n=1 Tax=Gottschalkia acidurici (strain ATCC 7906 / DSM 604 / BCRC 14475 / CIP 104303 / KCTC 5404 / NCIMB 10678 / 9a) TaxID=1128398 RepID=K0B5D8_GOTA9|nr:DUF4178 domain-containing protein [Gottschalkia acidurici]AFS79756.1 hypothetical protein Curi_c27630 [Gottschalkia acidurici 9a]
MINDNLSLDIDSEIILNGVRFVVDGYILFEDFDGTRWIEYKLRSKERSQIRWLSVDRLNDEYAVYKEESYSEEFLEENIKSIGYRNVDSSSARVLDYGGNVDVDIDEIVSYKEYEDSTEELLISGERWGSDDEFSKGHYIDKDDIKKLDSKFNAKQNKDILDRINKSNEHKEDKKNLGITIAIILIIFVVSILSDSDDQDRRLSKVIESNSNFQYETSVTSDMDNSKKADVYSINKKIEEVAKLLIDELQGDVENVQESEEDGTVVIITTDEMALIYLSEDTRTLLQVSSREYVYSSRNTLYRGSHTANRYYRGYYNNKASNQNQNRYKTYSDSIKQSSVNSRLSSGGGISSGK